MQPSDFLNDIPLSVAIAAHAGTSHSPERRGVQERNDYASTLAADHAALLALADTEEKRAALVVEFARYRAGYRDRFVAYLGSRGRCVSTLIAGPSGFNVRRAEKANASERNRSDELTEYRERALKAIHKVLRPEDQPIMAGDADAVERLRAEIADAEQKQQHMKDDNAAARKAKTTPPWPSFKLTNAGARLRGMRERLVVIERNKGRRDEVIEGAAGIRYEDSPADNRVRLFFPGKPDATVRDRLKSAGFRWAPSIGAWQAFRNRSSVLAAREFAGVGLAAVPSEVEAEDEGQCCYPEAPGLEGVHAPDCNKACGMDLDALGRRMDPCLLSEGHEGGCKRAPRCAGRAGSTCDVSHDPAQCPCDQCRTAETAAS